MSVATLRLREEPIDLLALRQRRASGERVPFLDVDTFEGTPSDPTHMHKYLYGNGNPVMNIDPTGMDFTLSGRLVVAGLMALTFTMSGIAILPTLRNSSAAVGLGKFVPIDANRLESHYHSIRIRGVRGGADAVFKDMQRFSQLNMAPVRASGDITGVGADVSFDMTPIFNDLGQGDFSVRVTKFDPQQRFFVVRTLAGHPLAGWRYWGVQSLPDGDVLVETFSVEHAATNVDQMKLNMGGMDAMYGTWTTFLRDIVRRSGGAEVADHQSNPKGHRVRDPMPYLIRVQ